MSHAFALSGSNLISFDTSAPTSGTVIGITNITAGETLVGIDFRPQNGLLYALGVDAASNTATLYAISTRTGIAAIVGTASSIALTFDGVNPVDLPDPATVGYGFDFNPAVDRIRVTVGGLNFRIDPNTGTAIDSDGGTTGTNPDGSVNGGTTQVDASAYTNNQPNNGSVTTLYTLDAATNKLFIQNPPNAGTQTLSLTVTLNGNPLDFTSQGGFDIAAGVNAAASNAAVTTGSAFAVLTVGGTTGLYSINLVNAQATFIGNILNGAIAVQGFAVQSDLGGIPAIALTADGTALVRFNTATTGTVTTQALDPPAAGETLVAIDFRPQTGQLYALGINATANTGTLYLVDPQTGALTIVGSANQIALVDSGGNPIDFPDPTTVGYGMDFNPTVDRIRITTDSGLNFRIRPDTGAPVDGDTLTPGTNPDPAINGGGVSGVSAVAYTNSYAGAAATTLYTLDATTNSLHIQNPANNGTQTAPLAITLGGNPLDFTTVNGFDIPAGVSVAASNTPATGFGYADLTVGGTTGLYKIDLATGAATFLGAIGAGATPLAGLALANAQSTPVIISNGGGATASLSTPENVTAVATVAATDGDLDAIAYAIIGGADAAKFQINASTGALAFVTAPDFENPGDADHNNSYIVQVRASDGNLSDTQTITVNVTNENDTEARNDFNGDGHSDILWQNADGTPAIWSMNGTSLVSGANAGFNPGAAWHVIGSGDFNGDGKADILWQNADGTPAAWQMDGTTILSGANVGFNPGADWHAITAADFNGDGKADILWQNQNGQAAIWQMDGLNVSSVKDLGFNPGAAWHVIDAGDFDGDGKADILWQNNNGQAAVWLMDGFTLKSGSDVGFNPGAARHVQGAGDFNGDGKSDILWQNADGTPAIWLMNGTSLISGANVGFNPGPAWQVHGTGDFNGDGKADIEWQNTDGTPAVWLMDGFNLVSGSNVGFNPGAAWHVIPEHNDLV
jgi:hypothetical protein